MLAAICFIVAGCVIYMILPREPSYQGKGLAQWMEEFEVRVRENNGTFRDNDPSLEAVRQMGPDMIPWLMSELTRKDSRIMKYLPLWIRNHPTWTFNSVAAKTRRDRAVRGFFALGAAAKPAIPQLLKLLDESEGEVKAAATTALGDIGQEPGVVIPVLVRCLGDPDPRVRHSAVGAFNMYGKSASAAVPALLKAIKDPDRSVQMHARAVVRRIAPEAAAKAGVE